VGGTIVIASREQQACLNLLVPECRTGGLALLPAIKQVLGGAFEVTGDLRYRPNLVAHADVVATNPFTVTYHIRPEAVWSDGQPVSARDFEFTWQVARSRAVLGAYHSDIRRIVVRGPKTVRVVFKERVADYREYFWVVLPWHALAGENIDEIWLETIDNPKTGVAIGNGPLLVRRWEEGQLTLVRNPRYWGQHRAYVDRIVYRFLPEPEHAEALRRGDVDLVTRSAAVDLRRQRPPWVAVVSPPGATWAHLELRMGTGGHPALKSPLVRRALAYGLDRRAIARTVLGRIFGQRASDSQVLDSVVFTLRSRFYKPHWAGYGRRPTEARRLLVRAGCRLGDDGVYVCGGQRLALRFVTTAGNELRKLTLDLISMQLKGIGVEVKPEFVAGNIFFNTVLDVRDFDVALFDWEVDPSLWAPRWSFVCKAEQNYTGYCRPSVTRDLLATTRMLDLGTRVRALNRIDAELAKDVPYIPLFQPPFLLAMNAKVRGVDPSSLSSASFDWETQNWWLAR
jgi:peptide/nickel transport system substrate-binding protein